MSRLMLRNAVFGGVVLAAGFCAADAPGFRAATYNVRYHNEYDTGSCRWEARKGAVAAMFTRHGFEICGVQEPVSLQVNDLLAALPGWAMTGRPRDDGRTSGEYSCIFYRTDRFELLNEGTFWLSHSPDVPASRYPGAPHPRICSWGLFRDRRTLARFAYFSTHLEYTFGEACRFEAALIARRAKEFEDAGIPVIICGDMNFEQSSGIFKPFLDVFKDARAASETPPEGPWRSCTSWKYVPGAEEATAPRAGFERIDHVFVSRDVRVKALRTYNDAEGTQYPSDHFPVSFDVELSAPAPYRATLRMIGEETMTLRPLRSGKAFFTSFDRIRPSSVLLEFPGGLLPDTVAVTPETEVVRADGRLVVTIPSTGTWRVSFGGAAPELIVIADPLFLYGPNAVPGGYRSGGNERVFAPGVHETGILDLKDGETLCIPPGAVVRGAVRVRGARDVRIIGRGVLDSSALGCAPVTLEDARNVTIDGLVFPTAPETGAVVEKNSTNVTKRNLKELK